MHEPVTGSCACPSCGGVLRPLGRDADELLDVVPVSWRVVRHVRPGYSCRACERIVQASAPAKAPAPAKAIAWQGEGDGCVAAYHAEMNPLIPLQHHDELSKTPTARSGPVRVRA